MSSDNLNKLISEVYNPIVTLKSKILTQNLLNTHQNILKNLSFNAYLSKTGYNRKTGYKTFYSRFLNKNAIFRNAFVNCKLHINQLGGDKNLVSLKNIGSISEITYELIKIIVENFEKDLCSNNKPELILNDDKFQQIKKELNNNDIKYFIHKETGTTNFPSISIQKFEINIIYTKVAENKKIIYKISQDDCNKLFTEKKIENFTKITQWLNTNADKCYAKIVPLKTTVGLKNIFEIISEDLLKNYNVEKEKKNSPCLVFNSHFEAIIIYNINKKFNNTTSDYMNEENIDDDYIFSNNITEESIENILENLKEFNIKYIKNVFSIMDSPDVDYSDLANE